MGPDRPGAAALFGDRVDEVLVTTFADLAVDLGEEGAAADDVDFVGVAAGEQMAGAVRSALHLAASRAAATTVAVELPADPSLRAAVADTVAESDPRVGVVGVRRHRGRLCLELANHDPAGPVDRRRLARMLLAAGPDTPGGDGEAQARAASDWELAAVRAHAEEQEARAVALEQRVRELRARQSQLRRLVASSGNAPGADPLLAQAPQDAAGTGSTGADPGTGRSRRPRRGRAAGVAVGAGLAAVVSLAVLVGLVASVASVAVVGIVLVASLGLAVVVAWLTALLWSLRRRVGSVQRLLEQVGGDARAARQGAVRSAKSADRAVRHLDRRTTSLREALAEVEDEVRRSADHVDQRLTTWGAQWEGLVATLPLARPAAAELGPPGWISTAPALAPLWDLVTSTRPARVLVLGAGAPALMVALACHRGDVPSRVLCLDHRAGAVARLRELLERHGVAADVEVRFAPLERTPLPDHATPWFEQASWRNEGGLDLVVVDGPDAAVGPAARLPAREHLVPRLVPGGHVVVVGPTVERDGDLGWSGTQEVAVVEQRLGAAGVWIGRRRG